MAARRERFRQARPAHRVGRPEARQAGAPAPDPGDGGALRRDAGRRLHRRHGARPAHRVAPVHRLVRRTRPRRSARDHRPILERYQRHLFHYRKADGTPLTIGTQFGCLTPLRTWFKWLAPKTASRSTRPSAGPPRLPKLLPRALLGVAEAEAILAAADPASPEGLRDRAMLEVLYSTGLRRTELAQLRRYDADLARLVVFVREGKGRKDRVVPLGERAAPVAGQLPGREPAALARWRQRGAVRHRLGRAGHARVCRRCGAPGQGPRRRGQARRHHLLRHACATHMLDNGADVRFIQEMLGHASLATTERYTHVAISKLQQVHAADPSRRKGVTHCLRPCHPRRRVTPLKGCRHWRRPCRRRRRAGVGRSKRLTPAGPTEKAPGRRSETARSNARLAPDLRKTNARRG